MPKGSHDGHHLEVVLSRARYALSTRTRSLAHASPSRSKSNSFVAQCFRVDLLEARVVVVPNVCARAGDVSGLGLAERTLNDEECSTRRWRTRDPPPLRIEL